MKQVLVILFSGMILMSSCGDSLPPGEKAGEGSTGERVGASHDTTGSSHSSQKDTSSVRDTSSTKKAY